MFSRIRAALAAVVDRLRAPASRRSRRAPAGTRGTGERGEDLAVAALRRQGYRILERNFRTPVGEIDVVAEEGETLCFVEVKWRRGTGSGHPAEAVTGEKRRRIARAAEWYLARRGGAAPACRFDVVAITAAQNDAAITAAQDEAAITAARNDAAITAPHRMPASVELFRDAFRGPYAPRRPR